jgi:hypothetical protein
MGTAAPLAMRKARPKANGIRAISMILFLASFGSASFNFRFKLGLSKRFRIGTSNLRRIYHAASFSFALMDE